MTLDFPANNPFGTVAVSLGKITVQGNVITTGTNSACRVDLDDGSRVCIDNTGIGMQLAERAQEKFGSYKVEPVTFTGPVKEQLAYPLRAAFEDKTIRVPGDEFIRADLRAVKKDTTAAGNIRFTADRGKNGHADRFWGLALMLHAASRPAPQFGYQGVGSRREVVHVGRRKGVLL